MAMVLFILTRDGYQDMRAMIGPGRCPVWVNSGVLSDNEVNSLRDAGIDLTCFTNPIDPRDRNGIDAALWTIDEHHPGDRVFVEVQSGQLA